MTYIDLDSNFGENKIKIMDYAEIPPKWRISLSYEDLLEIINFAEKEMGWVLYSPLSSKEM